MAIMAALQKSLILIPAKTRAARIIQKRFRKFIKIVRKRRKYEAETEREKLRREMERRLSLLHKPKSEIKWKIVNRGGVIVRINPEEEKKKVSRLVLIFQI